MRFVVAVAAALLLSLGSLPRAEAAPITWSNICSSGPLTTCASVKLDTAGDVATLQIKNLSGLYGSYENFVITGISFFNLGSTEIPDVIEGVVTMSGPTRTSNAGNPPPSWTVANISGSGGVLGLDFNAGSSGNDGGIASNCATNLPGGSNDFWMTSTCNVGGVTNALMNDGFVLIQFKTKGAWDLQATDTQFELHAQSNLGSVKLVSSDPEGSVTVTAAAVPEPASLTLLGLGLGGVAARLRRRKK
jgi:hypothetical protein